VARLCRYNKGGETAWILIAREPLLNHMSRPSIRQKFKYERGSSQR
jgi:hypothetical protein